jgi:BTB/POZ domain
MIRFVYTGTTREEMTIDQASVLLTAADKYLLPGLKTLVERQLRYSITLDNFVYIYLLAAVRNAPFLQRVSACDGWWW